MMDLDATGTRASATALLAACGLFAMGCATGNTPDLASPATQALFLRTTGTWVIEEEYSEPVSTALEPMSSVMDLRPLPDAEQVMDFYPVGRRMATDRSNVARRQDRNAMRQVVMMTGDRPDRLELSLDERTFRVRYDEGEPWDVPMTGARLTVAGTLVDTQLRIFWEEGGSPTLEREVEAGGVLRDNFQALSNTRLVLTRQAVFSGEVWQPTRFVYTRQR